MWEHSPHKPVLSPAAADTCSTALYSNHLTAYAQKPDTQEQLGRRQVG